MPPVLIWRFFRTIRDLLKDPTTRGAVYVVIGLLLAGMTFYHFVENWTWLDSLYFSVITLTTVGYGDFSPKTDAGKIFTMIYILAGLGTLAGFITLLAQKQQETRDTRQNRQIGESSATTEPAKDEPPAS